MLGLPPQRARRRNALEQAEAFVDVAARGEQTGEAEERYRVSRIAIEGVAEAGFGASLVAGRRARCGLPGEPVRFGGEDRLQEPPHERLGLRADELRDARAVAKRAHRGDALHAELPA